MKKMSTTIVFFGNERLATGVTTSAPTLQSLIDDGYDVAAVVSNYEKGQSRSARSLEIANVAEKHGIPVLLPEKPMDIKEQLESYQASIGVLVAYGKIVPQSIIDIFPKGIINIHPSLLPLHRGPIPIESVILDGSDRTGVSIMQLVKAMDAGPVFGQSEVPLTGNETKQSLADGLLEIGGAMLHELLPGILEGSIVGMPQDDSRATYDNLINKDDGEIDWSQSALSIEREIRAFVEWPKSRTKIAGKEIVVTKARISDESGQPGQIEVWGKDILVFCGEKALIIERLKPAGKNEMTSEAFLAGHRHLL
jgi:methionyl-tRNA formyltransferase